MAAIGFIVLNVIGIFIVFLGFLADAQRQQFGVISGNLLLSTEVAVLVIAGLAASFWRKGKKDLSICLASWGAAAFFAFIAWFVHPEQTISRAVERLGEWELVIDDYRIEQVYGEKDKDASVRFQRLATELSARRSEYEAALTRHKGDPEFFHSSFFTWSFGAIAVAFAITGLVMFRRLAPYARQP